MVCSELVSYHIAPMNQVITNTTSSAILYILTNHSPVLEGSHYVHKHMHTVTKCHYVDPLYTRINVKFKHTCWVIINHKA